MVELGEVLKKARLEKGLTLEDVATSCGYSKALISRIENNNVFPSIESLSKIASALDLPLYDIFASLPSDESVVLRKSDRGRFKVEDGDFEMEFLILEPQGNAMLPVRYSGEPGAHSTHRMGMHIGQEWAIVTKGTVEVTVGEKKYILKKDDTIYFNSGLPHKYVNVGKDRAHGICVTIPPSY